MGTATTARAIRPYAALITDAGVKRKTIGNADAVGYLEANGGGLYIVADGVGTKPGSKQASHVAVAKLKEYYRSHPPAPGSDSSLRETLKGGFDQANRAVLSTGKAEAKGSTTMVAALIDPSGRACFANVGDSRAYLLRGGQLRKITIDHSWSEEQVMTGRMTRAEAGSHPRESKIINRSVGKFPQVEADLFFEQLQPGDTILLCSDGLYRMVAKQLGEDDDTAPAVNQRLAELITKYPPTKLADAARELVSYANAAGGEDNVSVALVRLPQADEAAAATTLLAASAATTRKPIAGIPTAAIGGLAAAIVLLAVVGVLIATGGKGSNGAAAIANTSPTIEAEASNAGSGTSVSINFAPTPLPTMANGTMLPAPQIVAPQAGQVFGGSQAVVTLSWSDSTPLKPGEDYLLQITLSDKANREKATDTKYTLSPDQYYNHAGGICWAVQREQGGAATSERSAPSCFAWLPEGVTAIVPQVASATPIVAVSNGGGGQGNPSPTVIHRPAAVATTAITHPTLAPAPTSGSAAPTATSASVGTLTNTLVPPTHTPRPPTNTPVPPTDTPVPPPTNTLVPPTNTLVPPPSPTNTPSPRPRPTKCPPSQIGC